MPFEAARLYITVGADIKDAQAGLGTLTQNMGAFESSVKSGIATGLGMSAFNAVISAGASAMESIKHAAIDYNATLEQTRITFTTMLAPVNNGFRDLQEGAKIAGVYLAQLRDFATKTPFEFPDVLEGARRLQAMGFAAQEVIPLLTDVGNVASAMGQGAEGINRITLALGQMNASGKVMTQDLNQLIQVGVPVWQILADATGKTTGEVRKMVEQGQIASDVFIKAFHDWSTANFGGEMAAQSRTFIGAMSNVKDSLTDTFATAALPLFEAVRDRIVGLADVLGTDQFKIWSAAFAAAVGGMVTGAGELVGKLKPIGDAVGDLFAHLGSGDVKGAFDSLQKNVATGAGNIVEQVNVYGRAMFGAGWNLVTELGSGIAGAFNGITSMVADALAGIAVMLIGNSPPAEGPLAAIDKGGENTAKAYVDGLATGLTGLKPVVDQAVSQVGGLKAANEGIEDTIRALTTQIQGIGALAHDTQQSIDAIKQSEEDRLKPLEAQKKSITERLDYTREEQSLGLQLKDIELDRAEAIAKGSSEVRAQLETHLDEISAQKSLLEIEGRRAEIAAKSQGPSNAERELAAIKDQSQQESIAGKTKSQAEITLERLRGQKVDTSGETGTEKQLAALRELQRQVEITRKTKSPAELALAAIKGQTVGSDEPSAAETLLKQLRAQKVGSAEPTAAELALTTLRNQKVGSSEPTAAELALEALKRQRPTQADTPDRPLSAAANELERLKNQAAVPFVGKNADQIKALQQADDAAQNIAAAAEDAARWSQQQLRWKEQQAELDQTSTKLAQDQLDNAADQVKLQKQAADIEIKRQSGKDVADDVKALDVARQKLQAAIASGVTDQAALTLKRQQLQADIDEQTASRKADEEALTRAKAIQALEESDAKDRLVWQAEQIAAEATQAALEKTVAAEKRQNDIADRATAQAYQDSVTAWQAQVAAQQTRVDAEKATEHKAELDHQKAIEAAEKVVAAEKAAEHQAELDHQAQITAQQAIVDAEQNARHQLELAHKKLVQEAEKRVADEKAAQDLADQTRATTMASLEKTIAGEKAEERGRQLAHQKAVEQAEATVNAEHDKEAKAAQDRALKIASLEKTVKAEKAVADENQRKRQLALNDLDLQSYDTKRQIAALEDRPALVAIETQRKQLDAQKQQLDMAAREEEIRRKIALLPIDQQIASIKRDTEATLDPLERQLKIYQNQKQELEEQKQHWSVIKQTVSDMASDAKEAERAAKAAAKVDGPSVRLAPGVSRLPTLAIDPGLKEQADKIKQAGKDLAGQLSSGFEDEVKAHFGGLAGAALGAAIGGIAFGPIGAIVGGALGGSIGQKLQDKLSEMGITPDVLIDALDSLFHKVKDELAPAFELFLANVNSLFAFLSEHKEVIAGIVAAFATFQVLVVVVPIVLSVAAAIGTVITAVAGLTEAIALVSTLEMVGGFTALVTVLTGGGGVGAALGGIVALLGGPVTLTIIGISAVIGLLTAAWIGNWGDIQGKTAAVVEYLGRAATTVGDALGDIGTYASDLYRDVADAWDDIKSYTETIWNGIKSFLTEWWAVILLTVVGGPIGLLVGLIYKNWDDIVLYTTTIWDGIKQKIKDVWDLIPEDVRTDLQKIYDAIELKWGLAKTFLSDTAEAMWKAVTDKFEEIKTGLDTKTAAAIKLVQDAWTIASGVIGLIWEGIKKAAYAAWDQAVKDIHTLWDPVATYFETKLGDVKLKFTTFIGGWWVVFGEWAGKIKTDIEAIGKGMVDGLWLGLDKAWTVTKETFWGWVRAIISGVKSLLGIESPSTVFSDIGKSVVEGFKAGIAALWEGAGGLLDWAKLRWADFVASIHAAFGIDDADSSSTRFTKMGSTIVNGLKAGVMAVWEGGAGLLEWSRLKWNEFIGAIHGVFGIDDADTTSTRFLKMGSVVMTSLKAGVAVLLEGANSLPAYIGQTATDLVGKFLAAFGLPSPDATQASVLFEIGGKVIRSLWDGMSGLVVGFFKWLHEDVIDKIPKTIRDALGIESPSRVMFDLGANIMQGLIHGMQSRMGELGGVQSLVNKLLGKMGGGGAPAAPEVVRGWLLDAVRLAGAPESWLPGLEIIAMNESGGNPRNVNPEAVVQNGVNYGHATGLMQTIPSTFDANKLQNHGDIWNPVDNAAAAIHYIQRRYGDVWSVPGVRSMLTGGPYLPYRRGGVTNEDIQGVGQSGNRYMIHRDEGIFNADQMERLATLSTVRRAIPSGGGGAVQNIYFLGAVYGFDDFAGKVFEAGKLNNAMGKNTQTGRN